MLTAVAVDDVVIFIT